MPVHRKRFRIEEVLMGDMPVPSAGDGDSDWLGGSGERGFGHGRDER